MRIQLGTTRRSSANGEHFPAHTGDPEVASIRGTFLPTTEPCMILSDNSSRATARTAPVAVSHDYHPPETNHEADTPIVGRKDDEATRATMDKTLGGNLVDVRNFMAVDSVNGGTAEGEASTQPLPSSVMVKEIVLAIHTPV